MNRGKDTQTNRHTGGQIDRQTGGLIDRQTDRETEMDRWRDGKILCIA